MSRAIEMKNLVSDIKASAKDRLQFVKDNKTTTHQLLEDLKQRIGDIVKDTRHLLGEFDKEAGERTQDLKHLIADFHKVMADIQARIKEISHESRKLVAGFTKEGGERADDIKNLLAEYDKEIKVMAKELGDFLKQSENTRLADFDMTIKDVRGQVKDVVEDTHKLLEQITKDIQALQKDVKDLLDGYREEQKETAHAWAPIRKKWAEMAPETEEAEEVKEALSPKRGRKSKK